MGARENKFQISWELRKRRYNRHVWDFIWWNLKFLKFVFSGSDKNLFFGVISYNLLQFIAHKKCKKECNMLEIILVQGFCPLLLATKVIVVGYAT